ncbi:putative monooxygenase [Stipitochalara longipes BDJ]|nr:putative monooxygenase [Stipitochalara longipes BDJ]
MPPTTSVDTKLRVAIIGAGPAGLGAAIEFGKLPFVDWILYEQATAIREIGAGISVQPTMAFIRKDYYQTADHHAVQHRNGRTGELLVSLGQGSETHSSLALCENNSYAFITDIPPQYLHARTQRSKLQDALFREIDESRLRLKSRLIKIEQQPSGKLLLKFEDGFTDLVDLLVGADGVRSVVRSFAFPSHKIGYTGKTAYRTTVTPTDIATVPGVPDAVTFWHGSHSWLYTCALGANKYEVTAMTRDLAEQSEKEKVSWGQDATTPQMADNFKDFSPLVKDILALAKDVKQYALFAGPRLESIVARGSVALVGDASHRAGAGFALEDVYALTKSIAWAREQGRSLKDGLELLDNFGETAAYLETREFAFDEAADILVERNLSERHTWIYEYDIQQVFKDAIEEEKSKHFGIENSDFQGGLSRL